MAMDTAYVCITVLTAVLTAYAAAGDFLQTDFVVSSMTRLGVLRSWLVPLGAAKAAGALGLLVGFVVPVVGAAAAVGLILFFVGAILTVIRARWWAHYYPAVFLTLAAASLALRLATW